VRDESETFEPSTSVTAKTSPAVSSLAPANTARSAAGCGHSAVLATKTALATTLISAVPRRRARQPRPGRASRRADKLPHKRLTRASVISG
jgi:hypothetical protein